MLNSVELEINFFWVMIALVNQYLHHNLGYKKYKLFEVTKFILVLPTFDWYNSHYQKLDVEWKVYILF